MKVAFVLFISMRPIYFRLKHPTCKVSRIRRLRKNNFPRTHEVNFVINTSFQRHSSEARVAIINNGLSFV